MSGAVVAAHQAAAEAGAAALEAGGTALDAAVATAFALCVVDPANSGLGGYGGFLVYAPPAGAPVLVDFNTWVPDRLDVTAFRLPGDHAELLDGGGSVAPPAVVPGLVAAQTQLGRLALPEVVAPAIRLARDGFQVDGDRAYALAEHWERTAGGNDEFASIFFPNDHPPGPGTRIVQPDLAETLDAVASRGAAPFRSGPIVDAMCETVRADGGFLEPADFLEDRVAILPAGFETFQRSTVYGAPKETSGAGVLFAALAGIDTGRLGANRSRGYIAEVSRALAAAWHERTATARAALNARHTTNLCAADGDGGLAALTFTHGSLFFGSGLVAPGTGVVLNAGVNLFATADGGPLAVTNMCPVIVEGEHGARHALGGTGGPRIPGILLTAVVDVVHYASPLAAALAAPHISVRPLDGVLEAEPELLDIAGTGVVLGPSDYGPAAGITRAGNGVVPAVDPRFDSGVAFDATSSAPA